jgi:hypothetical protein
LRGAHRITFFHQIVQPEGDIFPIHRTPRSIPIFKSENERGGILLPQGVVSLHKQMAFSRFRDAIQ